MSMSKYQPEMEKDWVPRLLRISRLSRFPEHDGEITELRHYRLLLLQQGKGSFLMNGEPVALRAPALYLMKPGMKVESGRAHFEPQEWYQLDFELYALVSEDSGQRLYQLDSEFGRCGSVRHKSVSIARAILQLHREADEDAAAAGKIGTMQRMLRLLELLLPGERDGRHPESAERFMKLAVEYAVKHSHEEIRMEKLADIACMQPATFSRKFKDQFGKSPVDFVNGLRMNRAKELLLLGTYRNMRDVAQQSGFRDEFYFSKRFKQQHRIPPSQYGLQVTANTSVISLSYPYTEHLLQLGIVPRAAQVAAATQTASDFLPLPLPYHAKEPWEMSRQTFLECGPDVIVCKDNVMTHARMHVGDLAPIISFPWRDSDVYELHLRLGELLGRGQTAKRWTEQFRQSGASAAASLPPSWKGATLAICVRHANGWRLYGARNIGHVFYRMLGFVPPRQVSEPMSKYPPGRQFTWTELDADALTAIEADYLLFVGAAGLHRQEIERRLRQSDDWKRHPAIQRRRFAIVDWERWMIYAPLSLKWQLEQAVRLFD